MYADINYSVCDFQSLVINYTLQAQKDFQTLLIQGFFFGSNIGDLALWIRSIPSMAVNIQSPGFFFFFFHFLGGQ